MTTQVTAQVIRSLRARFGEIILAEAAGWTRDSKKHLTSSGNKKEGIIHDTFERLENIVLFGPERVMKSLQFIHSRSVHWVPPVHQAPLQVPEEQQAENKANAVCLQRIPPGGTNKVNKQTNNVIPESTKCASLVSNERTTSE